MPRLAGSRGSLQRAGKPGEERAEREHRGEEPRLVDAERCGQRAVLARGADQDAEARARDEQR